MRKHRLLVLLAILAALLAYAECRDTGLISERTNTPLNRLPFEGVVAWLLAILIPATILCLAARFVVRLFRGGTARSSQAQRN
jgi:hypothetical protein